MCFKRWTDFLHPHLPHRVSTITPSAICGITLLELLFLEHVNDVVDSYLVDLDLAMIALSCHFAFDLLCYKEEVLVSAR